MIDLDLWFVCSHLTYDMLCSILHIMCRWACLMPSNACSCLILSIPLYIAITHNCTSPAYLLYSHLESLICETNMATVFYEKMKTMVMLMKMHPTYHIDCWQIKVIWPQPSNINSWYSFSISHEPGCSPCCMIKKSICLRHFTSVGNCNESNRQMPS